MSTPKKGKNKKESKKRKEEPGASLEAKPNPKKQKLEPEKEKPESNEDKKIAEAPVLEDWYAFVFKIDDPLLGRATPEVIQFKFKAESEEDAEEKTWNALFNSYGDNDEGELNTAEKFRIGSQEIWGVRVSLWTEHVRDLESTNGDEHWS